MSTHDSPTIRRFVRTAWIMLGFQLVFAVGAIGVAIWAASAVRQAVDERDLLQARVAELEAGRNQAAPAPTPTPTPVEQVAPEPEPVNEVAPPPEQPVQNTPTPPVTRTPPPVRQPPIRTTPPVYTPPPPVYNPPVYNPPPVYTPPPRVDDKPQVVREDPPRRRRPRINVDVPGLIGGIINRPRRDTPVQTPGRNPTAPQGNPTRPPSNTVPGRTTTTVPPPRRRVPPATTQQPPIR